MAISQYTQGLVPTCTMAPGAIFARLAEGGQHRGGLFDPLPGIQLRTWPPAAT
jgi:hypothetical protein